MQKIQWKGDLASITSTQDPKNPSYRRYLLKTTASLRDNLPENKERIVGESETFCRSSSSLFDGLFALVWEEANENQVDHISDWSFEAEGIKAFETGKKWNYIWTRDTAYSAHLSLGLFNPTRLKNSLEFKLSAPRHTKKSDELSCLQIVQDTGSGGSWPISTDRVSWALGAKGLESFLDGNEREDFIIRAYHAIKNTLLIDRDAIFDVDYGLYRGEQSFLDWREQTYPLWTKDDTLPIARSLTLSTNICHYVALTQAAHWAKRVEPNNADAKQFEQWAIELKASIDRHFWDEEAGLYRSMILEDLIESALQKYELLGNAFAVLFDIASSEQALRIVASYPLTEAGSPVIHPQLPDVPIYHNRAIWPFVSAYALEAAKKTKNAKVFHEHAMSLMRGAALNLSNMENFECTTLAADYHDLLEPQWDGPVVNSQRQLWSVAAYLNMTIKSIFGLDFSEERLRLSPALPAQWLGTLFDGGSTIKLQAITWRKKKLSLTLHLPRKASDCEWLELKEMTFNGQPLSNNELTYQQLKDTNCIEAWLDTGEKMNACQISEVNFIQADKLFAPPTVRWQKLRQTTKGIEISFSDHQTRNFAIYRNRRFWKTIEATSVLNLTQLTPGDQLVLVEKGVVYDSHPSPPITFAPNKRLLTNFASENISNCPGGQGKNANIAKLQEESFEVHEKALYQIQLAYRNQGPINTGITAGLRKITVFEGLECVTSGICAMPHYQGEEICWSTPLNLNLEKGKSYRLEVSEFPNMSSLMHFEKYTKRGGKSGADNQVELHSIYLTRLSL